MTQRRNSPKSEHRGDPRTDISHSASLALPDGGHLACTIMNISRSGALLKLAEQKIPALFELVIEEQQFCQRCALVWQKGDLLGIRFQQELARVPDFLLEGTKLQPKQTEEPASVPAALADTRSFQVNQDAPGLRKASRSFSSGFGKRR